MGESDAETDANADRDTGADFRPQVALASLSGEADAEWARDASGEAGLAFLGGIAVDDPTRAAAERMVADRNREEFLPDDPVAFVADELERLADAPIDAGVNVRATTPEAIRPVARVCAARDALLEVNAHCRQSEMCAAGAGETLLADTDRLCDIVAAASDEGATTSVKVRAAVSGVDLPALAGALDEAGATVLHVDAMDAEGVVASVRAAFDGVLIANNGVRDRETVREYLAYGADAVSIGRPSDDSMVRARVRNAVTEWFADARGRSAGVGGRVEDRTF
ncbi:tRNA-dihydrouridine synthase [Halarchaeum nitratireducens]|uniref:Dihydropyrimidine dehydrogenase n=1 Tax=Halarchaeum nitratireducens TaxID=489913 RepID=A0A830G9R3_9EURY|nr:MULTISPECIES: tRNA-dihydrouridine synthase [Halarchaeum]MBP2250523.1 TIM-barrel protein [Halarchaeum solikamskense]GGN15035.1 dihydropyrimidine dehydrogenase [Halarchaeum nitratireducens]